MKAIFLLIITLTLLLFSCTGEENCIDSGCESDKRCVQETGLCEKKCTPSFCEAIGQACSEKTGLCEDDCTVIPCRNDKKCNTETKQCEEPPCSETGCKDKFICDEETQICKPDGSCRALGCEGTDICNIFNGKCEAPEDYPAGPYSLTAGNTIKNLAWKDIDGNEISLKDLYNSYLKTGYPRAVLLIASAGWCGPCRDETPRIQKYYKDMTLNNGFHKLFVIQTVINANDNERPATDNFVKGWQQQYGLDYIVVNDTEYKLGLYNETGGIPFNMILNPLNMKIMAIRNGTDEDLSDVKSVVTPLYKKNGPCSKMNCTENQYCQAVSNDGACKDGQCNNGFICKDNSCVADPKQEEIVKCYDRN